MRRLENVRVQVGNLGTSILGLETAGVIQINQTAAGHGWYLGSGSPGAAQVDLLTVLEHELGHVLDLVDNTQAGDVMDTILGVGVRRAPTAADARDAVFALLGQASAPGSAAASTATPASDSAASPAANAPATGDNGVSTAGTSQQPVLASTKSPRKRTSSRTTSSGASDPSGIVSVPAKKR
ncbi:MAG: hypothetical protein ACLQNE_14270 [Thermoguttaceae bacterium]